MSHFQSLSAPFVDTIHHPTPRSLHPPPSSSTSSSTSSSPSYSSSSHNHSGNNNTGNLSSSPPQVHYRSIAPPSHVQPLSPGIRPTIASPRRERNNKPDNLSFEEGRRKALAATELALASPRSRDEFTKDEVEWEDGLFPDSKGPRPDTQQFYAQGEEILRAEDSASSKRSNIVDEEEDSEYTHTAQHNRRIDRRSPPQSAPRDIDGVVPIVPARHQRRPSETSQTSQSSDTTEYIPVRPGFQRSLSDSSNESSSQFQPHNRSGSVASVSSNSSTKRSPNSQVAGQTRLRPMQSVPESSVAKDRAVSHSERTISPDIKSNTKHPRQTPRSSSIDSAISHLSGSSSSNAGHIPNSPEEIAQLIQSAGSAEALISHLLKDKAQAQAQNAQLWRLVDKQRSMILTLNRDMEKAMKDKEKFRKKLKEYTSAVPPVPGSTAMTGRPAADSPTPSEDHSPSDNRSNASNQRETAGRASPPSGADEPIAPYPITPPSNAEHPMMSIRSTIEERMPEPAQHIAEAEAAFRQPASIPKKSDGEVDAESKADADAKAGFSRKNAPAPLQLRKQTQGFVAKPANKNDENSEERGRQRNREDGEDGPLSPRMPLSPRAVPPADNIKSTVVTVTSPGATSRPGVDGIKSPGLSGSYGLPSSPRPVDRPPMSPMFSPRRPRESYLQGSGPASPSVAPRDFMGLPQSPRGGFPGSLTANAPLSPRMISPPSQRFGGAPLSPRMISPPSQRGMISSLSPESVGTIGEQLMGNSPPMTALTKEIKVDEKSPPPFIQKEDLNEGNNVQPQAPSSSPSSLASAAKDKPPPKLLVVPPALQTVDPKVLSTRLRMVKTADNPKGREQLCFTMAICSRNNGSELWRVEKDVASVSALDAKMRQFANPKTFTARLPEKSLFTSHAPARVDMRKVAIEDYFASVLNIFPLEDRAGLALCEYVSQDVIDPTGSENGSVKDGNAGKKGTGKTVGADGKMNKEGYLTKRGKNFGGWKARYFVLDGPVLRYFETPGGAHLGSIKLHQAQIGKQSSSPPKQESNEDAASDNQYRHAFLILEPKRKDSGSHVRHVLCAENDTERDEWVECLMQYIESPREDGSEKEGEGKSSKKEKDDKKEKKKEKEKVKDDDASSTHGSTHGSVRGVPYDETVAGEAPARGPTPIDRSRHTPSPPQANKGGISAPTNGNVITDVASWGNKPLADKNKKKGIWGFRARGSSPAPSGHGSQSSAPQPTKIPANRSVFGSSLAEAVELSHPIGVDLPIPSVVYRSIEYLDAKNAIREEGIFRLSGSNTTIKQLRERFNAESDVNLLQDSEYHDIHAVAGLLKLYLRELPSTVLTRDMHADFVAVLESDDRLKRVHDLNGLVHKLPIENFTLLKILASHLLTVIENADINKMTVRNVGIVFSPTLNIPAGVFSLFLMEYPSIFFRPGEEGYEEPVVIENVTEQTIHHPAYSTASGGHNLGAPQMVGLPSTPRRMHFDTSPAGEEKRKQDQQNFRALMENRDSAVEDRLALGGNNNLTLGVPGMDQKKKKRESAMLGIFSSNKGNGFTKKEKEMSPNPYDDDMDVYE